MPKFLKVAIFKDGVYGDIERIVHINLDAIASVELSTVPKSRIWLVNGIEYPLNAEYSEHLFELLESQEVEWREPKKHKNARSPKSC